MPNLLIYIFVVITVIITFSPAYLQRRKLWRMADEDLKRINYDEWKKQMRSNAYIKLGSCVIWGLFILSSFILRFREVISVGFSWTTVFVFVLGVSVIVWGVLRFRQEIKKVSEII